MGREGEREKTGEAGFGEGAVRMAQEQESTGRDVSSHLLICQYVGSSHRNKIHCKLPETGCFKLKLSTERFKISNGSFGITVWCGVTTSI